MADEEKLDVSADKYTSKKLNLGTSVSKEDAKRIKDSVEDSKEFHAIMERDKLIVKRKLRD